MSRSGPGSDPGVARTIVRASAGCGKTTDLACRYLAELASGSPARQTIAITFTRRAAAELEERVSLALRGALEGEAAQQARARLGRAWPRYQRVVPSDPEIVRRALASLPEAPIGTTDAFVQQLLTEFALDAALPLPGETRAIPLDLPIHPRSGVARALEQAARRVLDPPVADPDGALDPDVALLTRYYTLDQLLADLARRTDHDELPMASSVEVLGTAARWMAEALAPLDLASIYGVSPPGDEAAWTEALLRATNRSGSWAIAQVAGWLAAGAAPERAPYALCGWLQGLPDTGRRREIRAVLMERTRSFGPAELSLWQVVHALRYPYDDDQQVKLADRLREARWRLRRRVLATGLERAALAGELGYDELLEAAIALCERPPPRLRTRFCALLVDEVQDSDPRQLRLYDAIARLGPVRCTLVGDTRQSIYLFRGAEPDGLRRLAEEAEAGSLQDLLINRRSAPGLIEAQRALFGALDPRMRSLRWRPVASLDGLESDPANAALALPDAEAPVQIVAFAESGRVRGEDLDDAALRVFVERLARARAEHGHEQDTAVVLAPTWHAAERAARQIREWAGRADAAFVEGTPGKATGRVADDLRLWLRALLDRFDDVAWLGLWKHPAVGLSDAALARIVAGVGHRVEDEDGQQRLDQPPTWWRHLGWVIEAPALGSPHDEADIRAFARARPALRWAAARIGRTSTASVLDRLVTDLGWRTVLAAGPGGVDDVAELEVLLDWIRDHDADGRSADSIVALLDDVRGDRPHVRVERPPGHVACTTIFQAKGLDWDHVCVLRPGRHARLDPGRDHEDGWMSFDGRRVRIEGLRFDPRGGLLLFHDPLGRLAARIHAVRYTEEAARLAYVAITRARRTVTFALARPSPRSRAAEPRLPDVMAEAWLDADLPGVARIEAPPPSPPRPPLLGRARAIPGAALPSPPPGDPARWTERQPRDLLAHLAAGSRARHAAEIAERIRSVEGLHLGSAPVPAADLPDDIDPQPLASGWLARWRFDGPPSPEAIERYLAEAWGGADPAARDWLAAVSDGLLRTRGPLWSWVTDPDATVHFAHPLLGLGWQHDRGVLLAGRVDIAVERGDGRMALIDIDASEPGPSGWGDLPRVVSPRGRTLRLCAYADTLRSAGRSVEEVAVWFVRTGTAVRWAPG